MSPLNRPTPSLPIGRLFVFLAVFLGLYAIAAAIAEHRVARSGSDTAFQRLWAERGQPKDWVVLGASHALPLDYGDVPVALERDTGQSMVILAEVGAGPLYNAFVFRQAQRDIAPRHLLYVLDSFGFQSAQWNETRVADRKLLRGMPLRVSTLAELGHMVLQEGVSWKGWLDYVTAFSKLNPPDLFAPEDWRGRENFDRAFRPSRQATQARIDYLFPATPSEATRTYYLNILSSLFSEATERGISVVVVKPPVPAAFRNALPDEAAFDADLRDRLQPLGIAFHDFSAALDDPSLYFDPDHLNRQGVDRFYREFLLPILQEAQ